MSQHKLHNELLRYTISHLNIWQLIGGPPGYIFVFYYVIDAVAVIICILMRRKLKLEVLYCVCLCPGVLPADNDVFLSRWWIWLLTCTTSTCSAYGPSQYIISRASWQVSGWLQSCRQRICSRHIQVHSCSAVWQRMLVIIIIIIIIIHWTKDNFYDYTQSWIMWTNTWLVTTR